MSLIGAVLLAILLIQLSCHFVSMGTNWACNVVTSAHANQLLRLRLS